MTAGYATKETTDKLIASYIRGKYSKGVFGQAVKDFQNSKEALKQPVAIKYQNYLGRQYFKLVCKTQSSVYDAEQKVSQLRRVDNSIQPITQVYQFQYIAYTG